MIISFQPAPPCKEQEQVESKLVEMEENQDLQQKDTTPGDYLMFGQRPDTKKAYDFKK